MNHASLFSGIGGFDLAAREVGWNNVFQCEIDPFCQSVLKYYFPKTVLLAVSERHINGIGYGSLLPTVQTQGLKVCDKDGKTRFMDLSSLPKQGIKYGDLLPTPVASDHTGSCTIRKMTKSNGAPRTDSLRNMPAVIGMDGDRLNGRVFQLSPLFVEEMMGYPLMWTTLPFLTGNGEKNQ